MIEDDVEDYDYDGEYDEEPLEDEYPWYAKPAPIQNTQPSPPQERGMPKILEVLDPEGAVLGQIVVRNPADHVEMAQVVESMLPPFSSWRVSGGKVYTEKPKKPKKFQDPEVPADLTPPQILIGDAIWSSSYMGRAYPEIPGGNYILIAAAPTERPWSPNSPCPLSMLAPRLQSIEGWIEDEDGVLIANKTHKCVYVFGLWRASYAEKIEKLFGINVLDQPSDADLESFKKYARQSYERQRQAARQQIAQLEANLASYRQSTLDTLRALQAQRRLAEVADPPACDVKKICERIARIPSIRRVSVKNQNLIFTTDNINIEAEINPAGEIGPDKKTVYAIGRFKVSIDVVTGIVQFHNLTRSWSGTQHPHVRAPTAPCYGELSATVPEMITRQMYPELVASIMTYLKSVDVKDQAGCRIARWPVVKDPEEELKAAMAAFEEKEKAEKARLEEVKKKIAERERKEQEEAAKQAAAMAKREAEEKEAARNKEAEAAKGTPANRESEHVEKPKEQAVKELVSVLSNAAVTSNFFDGDE